MSDITIQVKLPNKSEKLDVVINSSDTVLIAKSKIETVSGTPASQQRLIFAGRVLKDTQIISECKIGDMMTVHMVPSASGSTTTPKKPEAAPVFNAPPSPSINSNPPQNVNNNNLPQGGIPNLGGLNSLFGNLLGGNQVPQGQNMFQSIQQQLLSNPQVMQQIMQNPMVQQLNQQIANNPELLREMIRNNPMMNEIIDRNPEVAHILNDPATLRQAVQMSQNPELLREVMRSNDRTIANIENIPGGYAYLARQYEDVIEPLQNAAIPQEQAPPQAPSVPPSPNPNNNPLPNPWAPNPSVNPLGGNPLGANPFGNFDPNLLQQMMGMFGGGQPARNPQPNQANPQGNQVDPLSSLFSQMMGGAGGGGGDFANLFGGFGGGAQPPYTPPANLQNMSPEARYAVQLQQMNDMGFVDQEKNVRCLVATGGNVNAAIERILSE